jgi:hypothetical protein
VSDVSNVRLLISDTSPASSGQIFTDAEIQAFLDLEDGGVKLAAAQALDAIASNEAMVSKRIKTLDLQTDGPAVAKSLREHASALREQVVGGEFEVTTMLGNPRSLAEYPAYGYY